MVYHASASRARSHSDLPSSFGVIALARIVTPVTAQMKKMCLGLACKLSAAGRPRRPAFDRPREGDAAGGVATGSKATEQFEIADDRSPSEVAGPLRARGFDAVWKDWDRAILAP